LVPVKRGIAALHAVVPDAEPVLPVETDHFTPATPTLSAATPVNVIVAAEVATIVKPGHTICNVGDVVSAVGGLVTGG